MPQVIREMKCSEIQSNVSLYTDGVLDSSGSKIVEDHLAVCPLCRECADDVRLLRSDLRRFGRPNLPLGVTNRLKLAVRDEIALARPVFLPGASGEWIRLRLIPLGVGIAASLVVGISFLTMMFAGARTAGEIISSDRGRDTRIMIAPGRGPLSKDDYNDISATEYARNRVAVAAESPSINPQGALIALTRSLLKGKMGDDEVVVVANVFSNGLAQITEVVEPSRNGRAVGELEKALDGDLQNAPFVPSVLDNRSENVRVVLKFRTVDVNTQAPRKKR